MTESQNAVSSEKAQVIAVESIDPYAVLSQEDAALMRRFEGKAGKKVTSKASFAESLP